jgi:hypothetical protein
MYLHRVSLIWRNSTRTYPFDGPRFWGVLENAQAELVFLQAVHAAFSFSGGASHLIYAVVR